MTAPGGVVLINKAETCVKLLGTWISRINQQSGSREAPAARPVNGGPKQRRGYATSPERLGHTQAVYVEFASLRLVLHVREIAAQALSRLVYERLAQGMELAPIVAGAHSYHVAMLHGH